MYNRANSRNLSKILALALTATMLSLPTAAQDNAPIDEGELDWLEDVSGEETEVTDAASQQGSAGSASDQATAADPSASSAPDEQQLDELPAAEVAAQPEDTATSPESEAAKPSGPKLDEIIVTAQKRAEDVQDVPLSVTAIGGETLKEKNIGDLASLSEYTPNMNITNTPTFNFIQMRGLGSGWNRGFEQSVAIVIDEVFYGRPSYLSNGQLDLSSVEVLRGPQGTLFGKNAVAGALHLRTARPTPEWLLDGDATYGTDNYQRYRGVVGGPLVNDDTSFRLSFMSETSDGDTYNTLIDKDENQIDNLVARMKFGWDISSDFRLMLSLNGGTLRQDGSGGQITHGKPRFDAANLVFDPDYNSVPDDKTSKDFAEYVDRDYWDTTLTAEYEWGDTLVTSITNLAWFDEDLFLDPDYTAIRFLTLDNNEDYRQFSEELRFTSGPGQWEYVAGIYAFVTDIYATYDYPTYLDVADAVLLTGAIELGACDYQLPREAFLQCRAAVLNNEAAGTAAGQSIQAKQQIFSDPYEISARTFDQQSMSFAAFGQVNWHWREDVSFTFGARVSYEEKEAKIVHTLVNTQTGTNGNILVEDPETGQFSIGQGVVGGAHIFQVFTPGIQPFDEELERTEFDISPKFSAQYKPDDDLMVYFTYGRGFKSGGFNAQPNRPNNLEFEEETSDTYEVGVKSEWLGGAARLNVSVFYTSFKGLQIAAFNGVEFVVDNAADATTQGVEWESMLVPMEGLLLSASGAYIKAEYDEFPGGPCQVDFQGPLPCDLGGETLPLAAEWQHTLSATWDKELFNWGFNFHAGIDALYQSENFNNADLDERTIRPAEWNINARLGFRGEDGQWSLMLFGDNLTDLRRTIIHNDTPGQQESFFGILEPGRSFELQGRYVF